LTQTYSKNKTNHQNLLIKTEELFKVFQNNSRLGLLLETLKNNLWNKIQPLLLEEVSLLHSNDNRMDSIPRVDSIEAYRF